VGLRAALGRLIALLLTISGVFAVSVSAQTPSADASPLIVYIETDPWAMVIGSDSPRFVLYDDGTAIYRSEEGYRAVTLTSEARTALADKINLKGLDRYTDYAEGITDQPESIIIDFRVRQAVLAYGATSRHRRRGGPGDPLIDMITLLREYQSPDAKAWEPEAIEVMIWPYEYAPDASIIWPQEWPGLDHPATVQRGDSYSLFVPISEKGALLAFLETRERRGAVELGGRKWAVSLRTPLPLEARWMRGMDTASSPAE
jgi:hypothetical protein